MNVIVAADKNWGLGKNNQLLVSIPADMKMRMVKNVLLCGTMSKDSDV